MYDATEVRHEDRTSRATTSSRSSVDEDDRALDVVPGRCLYLSTAQSRANLIAYLLEPETDDNLITWGWTDHVLEVRPKTVEEGMVALAPRWTSIWRT